MGLEAVKVKEGLCDGRVLHHKYPRNFTKTAKKFTKTPLLKSQVGPRLELEVVKVEEGLCDGRVLYHKYVKRSAEEAAAQQSEIEMAQALKEQRRRQQVGLGCGRAAI